jgi:hypothetical protein
MFITGNIIPYKEEQTRGNYTKGKKRKAISKRGSQKMRA